jgi:hypothetical protein
MHRLVRADHDLPVAVERTGTIVAQTRTSLDGRQPKTRPARSAGQELGT